MEKKKLADLLSNTLLPKGFKKKGSHWVINTLDVTKIIQLQKSQFSNSFYINYGYILKSVPLGNLTMHVLNRLHSLDDNKNARIQELLNMENDIPDNIRNTELKKFIVDEMLNHIEAINSESDLLMALKKRPHINDIPLVVKTYFEI